MATSMQIVEHEQPISEPSISLEPQPSQVVVEPLIRVESDSLSATEDGMLIVSLLLLCKLM